ncbi:hypothetical protein PR202_ga03716 [Eleusine coracana subsp. coracana]|uniref:Uncharacterized protein n=1 Tax=Eleusine coracana subsp. coracana TaxID=191504 RepID=A0AAV5BP27_ELECO|nr:hypothetical protein PR202_ga03716 [Eleusine coracana subsp. coracana]
MLPASYHPHHDFPIKIMCGRIPLRPMDLPPDQASALLELKNSFNTTGNNYTTFRLTSLKHLDLSGNDFNMSRLPATGFEQLIELTYLDLSDTNFVRFVPAGMSHLKKLVYLNLSSSFDVVNFDNEYKVIYFPSISTLWQLLVTNLESLLEDLTNLEELHLGMVNLSTNTWCDNLAKYNPKLKDSKLENIYLSTTNFSASRIHTIVDLKSYFPH